MNNIDNNLPDTSKDFDDCIGKKDTENKKPSLAEFLDLNDSPENEDDAWQEIKYHRNFKDHWKGMPSFDSKNIEAVKQLIINFESMDEFLAFSEVVGTQLTPKTRSIWYPPIERSTTILNRWIDDSEV
jgi:hypothetical protein